MRFGFRPGRRRSLRGFARRVRRVTGITLTKRIILDNLTIPDVTTVPFDNPLRVPLLTCTEAQDEELESDGSIVATTPIYSRLLSMRLKMIVSGANAQTVIRYIVMKEPDGEALLTSLANASFHSSNDTQNIRESRKMTVAKGLFVTNSTSVVNNVPISINRRAWKRISPMRENDNLVLLIAKDAAGTTCALNGFGNIWVKANG